METLIHADIFFFITSIFVGLLIIGVGVALFFVIPILKDLRYLSEIARREGTSVRLNFLGQQKSPVILR